MRKPTRRERRDARHLIRLAKTGKPPMPRPPTEAASRLMQVRNPQWISQWDDIAYLDEIIQRLQSLIDRPTSEALVIVADELRAHYRQERERLLSSQEFRPETLGELYTGVSYAHRYL